MKIGLHYNSRVMKMNDKNIKFNNIAADSKRQNQKNATSASSKDNKIIEKIMFQYDLSETEAREVFKNLENQIRSEQVQQKNNNLDNNQTPNNAQSEDLNIQPQMEEKATDIDGILSDIIPEYNKRLSIEVENIDLTFEVTTEKIDTIKESVIRFLKRQKTNKMEIHAINDISFKIYQGEKVGIIGYNGAGKSTLLSVICGIYKPDKGKVTTYGNISPLLGLGAGFDHNYSGRKNIYFNGAVLGYSKSYLKEREQEIIEFSELGEFIDIPVKNYSSGMTAKLGFSIATMVDPDILIIDEILGVGDATFAKKSRDKIISLMDGGTTVLLVSHSIPQIRSLCDKAIWIEKGKLKEIGDVNRVCDHYLKAAEKATSEQVANIQLR